LNIAYQFTRTRPQCKLTKQLLHKNSTRVLPCAIAESVYRFRMHATTCKKSSADIGPPYNTYSDLWFCPYKTGARLHRYAFLAIVSHPAKAGTSIHLTRFHIWAGPTGIPSNTVSISSTTSVLLHLSILCGYVARATINSKASWAKDKHRISN